MPASRVKIVARSLRLTESNQADDRNNLLLRQRSEWECELSRLRHDSLSEPHGCDYRSFCVFFLPSLPLINIQTRVSDSPLSPKGESRLRINFFTLEGFALGGGKALDLLTMTGHMRWPQRSPYTNPIIWKARGNILVGIFVTISSTGGKKDFVKTTGVSLD